MRPKINFIEPGAWLVEEKDLVRKVEMAYRICYKSEDKVSETSKSLVQRLSNSRMPDRHTSPLEHAWIRIIPPLDCFFELEMFIKDNPYIKADYSNPSAGDLIGNFRAFHDFLITYTVETDGQWVSAYSVVRELGNQLHDRFPEVFPVIRPVPDLSDSEKANANQGWEITEYDKYKTFHIITSRDILQELARHRTLSFSVESTRYCNYGNKGYTFVIPRPYGWTNDADWGRIDDLSAYIYSHLHDQKRFIIRDVYGNGVGEGFGHVPSLKLVEEEYSMMDLFFSNCYLSAARYDRALQLGIKPQEARMLLPGALKTELLMTGTDEQWEHFQVLRNSPAAHPMIKLLAEHMVVDVELNKACKETKRLDDEMHRLLDNPPDEHA